MLSIRLNKEEQALADSYSKLHGASIGTLMKNAFFEKIEDEYDIAVAEEAYRQYVESGEKSRPISEFWKELDL